MIYKVTLLQGGSFIESLTDSVLRPPVLCVVCVLYEIFLSTNNVRSTERMFIN